VTGARGAFMADVGRGSFQNPPPVVVVVAPEYFRRLLVCCAW
jgi:hypothetical protein